VNKTPNGILYLKPPIMKDLEAHCEMREKVSILAEPEEELYTKWIVETIHKYTNLG
jgi:hypothetical protein